MNRFNINDVLDDFNKLLPELKFNIEEEIEHKFKCLDITSIEKGINYQ
jgi:hypothetical protein